MEKNEMLSKAVLKKVADTACSGYGVAIYRRGTSTCVATEYRGWDGGPEIAMECFFDSGWNTYCVEKVYKRGEDKFIVLDGEYVSLKDNEIKLTREQIIEVMAMIDTTIKNETEALKAKQEKAHEWALLKWTGG